MNLEGNYCDSKIDARICYFFQNHSFKFIEGGHLPPETIGEGSFQIQEDKLILHYNELPFKYKVSYYEIEKSASYNSNVILEFYAYDIFDAKSIANVNVIYEDFYKDTTTGLALNNEGMGVINFPKADKVIRFTISDVRYLSQEISLSLNYNYKIILHLAPKDQRLPVSEGIDTLNILKLNREKLTLLNKSGDTINLMNYN